MNHPDFLVWTLCYYPAQTLSDFLRVKAGWRSFESYGFRDQRFAALLSLAVWAGVGCLLW